MQDRRDSSLLNMTSWRSALSLAIIVLAVVLLMVSPASGQKSRAEDGLGVSQVLLVNESEPAQGSPDASGDRMSPQFSSAAMHALSTLRWTRLHIAYTIDNGYPLSKYLVSSDRERATDALNLATISASTDADEAALRELLQHNAALQQWIDDLLVAYREMRLAEYYTTPGALHNDERYQGILAGEESLGALLGRDRAPLQRDAAAETARANAEEGQ